MLLKCYTQYTSTWKTQQWPQDWKRSVFYSSPKEGQCPRIFKDKSLSCVWLFVTPWTVAGQAPPSMGYSRQEYWSGLPFPSPRDLPDTGIQPRSWALQADFNIWATREAQECSNYCTTALISHTSKVMLKIFQARLQQYVKHELTDVQAGFRKGRGRRDQIVTIR